MITLLPILILFTFDVSNNVLIEEIAFCFRFSLRLADTTAHSDTFTYRLSPRPAPKPSARPGAIAIPTPGSLDARLLPGPALGDGAALSAASPPSAYFPTPGLHTLDCMPRAPTDNTTAPGLSCTLGRDGSPGDGKWLSVPRVAS